MPKTKGPATEAELCDALAIIAPTDGWDVFPEVDGCDLVLVWNGTRDIKPPRGVVGEPPAVGFQLAVDAKLRPNVDLLAQAMGRFDREWDSQRPRPDEHAVFVPEASDDFGRVAQRLGLRVLTLEHCADLPDPKTYSGLRRRVRIDPIAAAHTGKHLTLPFVPITGSGGRPSPRVMSPWRVKALRLVSILRARGWITGGNFKAAGVDRTRWLTAKWITADTVKPRADDGTARYTPGVNLEIDGPDKGYEHERDAIVAKDIAAASGRKDTP